MTSRPPLGVAGPVERTVPVPLLVSRRPRPRSSHLVVDAQLLRELGPPLCRVVQVGEEVSIFELTEPFRARVLVARRTKYGANAAWVLTRGGRLFVGVVCLDAGREAVSLSETSDVIQLPA